MTLAQAQVPPPFWYNYCNMTPFMSQERLHKPSSNPSHPLPHPLTYPNTHYSTTPTPSQTKMSYTNPPYILTVFPPSYPTKGNQYNHPIPKNHNNHPPAPIAKTTDAQLDRAWVASFDELYDTTETAAESAFETSIHDHGANGSASRGSNVSTEGYETAVMTPGEGDNPGSYLYEGGKPLHGFIWGTRIGEGPYVVTYGGLLDLSEEALARAMGVETR